MIEARPEPRESYERLLLRYAEKCGLQDIVASIKGDVAASQLECHATRDPSQPSKLLQLSVEVLARIGDNLPLPSLKALCLVSRSSRLVFQPILFRDLRPRSYFNLLRLLDSLTSGTASPELRHALTSTRSIRVSTLCNGSQWDKHPWRGTRPDNEDDLDDISVDLDEWHPVQQEKDFWSEELQQSLAEALPFMINLRSLDYGFCRAPCSLGILFGALTQSNVKQLALRDACSRRGDAGFYDLNHSGAHIPLMRISGWTQPGYVESLSALDIHAVIHAAQAEGVPCAALDDVLVRAHSLRRLCIILSYSCEDSPYPASGRLERMGEYHMPLLQDLELSFCAAANYEALVSFLSSCRQLQSLKWLGPAYDDPLDPSPADLREPSGGSSAPRTDVIAPVRLPLLRSAESTSERLLAALLLGSPLHSAEGATVNLDPSRLLFGRTEDGEQFPLVMDGDIMPALQLSDSIRQLSLTIYGRPSKADWEHQLRLTLRKLPPSLVALSIFMPDVGDDFSAELSTKLPLELDLSALHHLNRLRHLSLPQEAIFSVAQHRYKRPDGYAQKRKWERERVVEAKERCRKIAIGIARHCACLDQIVFIDSQPLNAQGVPKMRLRWNGDHMRFVPFNCFGVEIVRTPGCVPSLSPTEKEIVALPDSQAGDMLYYLDALTRARSQAHHPVHVQIEEGSAIAAGAHEGSNNNAGEPTHAATTRVKSKKKRKAGDGELAGPSKRGPSPAPQKSTQPAPFGVRVISTACCCPEHFMRLSEGEGGRKGCTESLIDASHYAVDREWYGPDG